MSRLNAANNAQSLLDGAISNADVTMTVLDGSIFPEPPFLVTVEDEIIEVGARSGNVFSSLLRGQEGTAAASHAAESLVENRMTVGMYDSLALQEDVTDLAGTGRTIETVKGNADDLAAHLAETVTYVASASRDISIAGTQTISGLPFTPKGIECMAYIPGTITKCQGYWAPNAQVGKATPGDTGVDIAAVGFIDIQPSGANYLSGVIKNVTATSFDIVWTKNATPTGTALLKFMIRGHQ